MAPAEVRAYSLQKLVVWHGLVTAAELTEQQRQLVTAAAAADMGGKAASDLFTRLQNDLDELRAKPETQGEPVTKTPHSEAEFLHLIGQP
jgi:hypothetical protein